MQATSFICNSFKNRTVKGKKPQTAMDMKPDIQDCQSNEQLKIPPEEVADRPGT